MARKGRGDVPEQDILDDLEARIAAAAAAGRDSLSVFELTAIAKGLRQGWAGCQTYIRHQGLEAYKPVKIDANEVKQRGVGEIATDAGISRATLYRLLKKNPE